METISQQLDFMGINFYTRAVYRADNEKGQLFVEIPPSDVALTAMGWEIYPQALTELLTSLNDKYSLPPIYITEKRRCHGMTYLKMVKLKTSTGLNITNNT